MMIVELGFKLKKSYSYYENVLKKHGLECVYECVTHDIYFSNIDFSNIDDMTEREIKEACIRFRQVNNEDFVVQNNLCNDLKIEKVNRNELHKLENRLIKLGYKKIFDTIKFDHHWYKDGMTTKVQLQEIKDVGLLVYFDNKEYYNYDLFEQRKRLIDELNSYGFEFSYDDLGLDKLRTLYYREEKFSENQNS